MLYIIEYEVCALIFLLIVCAHFFEKRWNPTRRNRFFAAFLVCGIVDISLDIGTAISFSFFELVPTWINITLNSIFYAIQVLLPALLFLYVAVLADMLKKKHRVIFGLSLIPLAFFETVVIANLFTHNVFYFDAGSVYHHGPYFKLLYLGSFFYFVLTGLLINIYRRRISDNVYRTIMCFLGLTAAAVAAQYFYPSYLLTGVAISLSITMMYLTLQNPSDMLDDVTGALNRASFMSYLHEYSGESSTFSFVILALRDIHTFGESLGFNAVNRILREVAGFLNSCSDNSYVYRVADDVFVIASADEKNCITAVERIRRRFKRAWDTNGVSRSVSFGMCYALNEFFGKDEEEIMARMERAVQLTREEGTDAVIAVDKDFVERIKRDMDIERVLRNGISSGDLEVYYQPIYNVVKKRFTCAEALMRYSTSELGSIPPSLLVPIAEKNGLICELSRLVIDKIYAFAAKSGVCEKGLVDTIGVNLSVIDMIRPELVENVISSADRHGVKADFISFEITETLASTISETLEKSMLELRGRGFKFSLDDYGTGYANIASIIKLPFSTIKIDRSMLVEGMNDERNSVLLADTVMMMKNLGLRVVVEGVETELQNRHVEELGADMVQGFYHARPMPGDEYLKFLLEQ